MKSRMNLKKIRKMKKKIYKKFKKQMMEEAMKHKKYMINGSIQVNLINQSQSSKNIIEDENSCHQEPPNIPKYYETQKLSIVNELIQKESIKYTTIGNDFSIRNDLRNQSRGIKFIGKKLSKTCISEYD